jgi:hypothetical protein
VLLVGPGAGETDDRQRSGGGRRERVVRATALPLPDAA